MSDVNRRTFLGVTASAAAAVFIKPELVRGTRTNSSIRVGLLGNESTSRAIMDQINRDL